jgi:lactate racemase
MHFDLPYGKQFLSINIPKKNIIQLVHNSTQSQSEPDEEKIILNSLNNPIDTNKLYRLLETYSTVCILVSDITRPCPSYKFLPYIIDELKKVKLKNIKILFGIGIHRKQTNAEMEKLVGRYVLENASIIDFDIDSTELIGTTSFGTPVEISNEVLSSDFLIATGNIEYHYFAGYSGGAKALMPGVCSKKSISANHAMMLNEHACAGEFYNNPVRQDIETAGKLVSIDFIFNVILDDSKHIISAVSGKNNEAFLEGIKLYNSLFEIGVNEKADMVITSPGGYPKDLNLYQSQKALDNVKGIVKDGGVIILVAECPEGYGEKKFEEWMADIKDYDKLYKRIKKEFVLGGHKAVAISRLLTKAKVYFYAEQEKSKNCKYGLKSLGNIQSFIDNKIRKNKEIKIAVIPNGRFIKFVKGLK